MSPCRRITGGVWSALFAAVVFLSLSATTTDARQFSWDSYFGCEEVPQGRWKGVASVQTNPGNTTLVPQFEQDIRLVKQIPNVYTGQAIITVTEFFPNPETLPPTLPPANILLVVDPATCAISMSLYSTAIPFNDVLVLTYRKGTLSGPYMASVNNNILTDVLSFFEAEYLGPY